MRERKEGKVETERETCDRFHQKREFDSRELVFVFPLLPFSLTNVTELDDCIERQIKLF